MVAEPETLDSILGRLKKPIRFALRQNSSNVMKVQGLADFVSVQVRTALSFDLPKEVRREFSTLDGLFRDFEALGPPDRGSRLREADGILRRLSERPPGVPLYASQEPSLDRSTVAAERPSVLWDQPVQFLKGVGPRRAEGLLRLGIRTLEDLLFFMPRRYEDRSRIRPIADLDLQEERTVTGTVQSAHLSVTSRRRFQIFEAVVGDDSGSVRVRWFNQPYLKKVIKTGCPIILTGKLRFNRFRGRGLDLENPIFEMGEEGGYEGLHTGRIVPTYPETRGWTGRMIRSLIHTALERVTASRPETLPEALRLSLNLMPLLEALAEAHFPSPGTSLEALNAGRSEAHRRLAFEEFLLLQLGLGLMRREVSEEPKGTVFRTDGRHFQQFIKNLPFQLTEGQTAVLDEIKKDMGRPHPMNRLLQGDVGCGKTVVALAAMMIAADNDHQAVFMAPTEILAEQHFLTIREWIEPHGLSCVRLTGGLSKREQARVRRAAASGEAAFVVGTHALIQEGVEFSRLGLAVVDEQHKFGVMQRATLRGKGYHPDMLIMTATPIPRTLALTLHGDLDLSVIRDRPKGRIPVETILLAESGRGRAYSLLARLIREGRQAYIVYPLVEESEKVDLKAAVEMAARLREEIFPGLKVGLLHGRLKAEEKEAVMMEFKRRSLDILVSTTVIEVGIDVPNATLMMIEHAERFGLSQLHQLRGRVGRGTDRSYCLLMASGPRSEEARRRLETMVRSDDGFVIAEEDLAIRGPGEFFGTRQSGLPELRVADLLRDGHLLERARETAGSILEGDPRLSRPEHAPLKAALARKWSGKLELFTVS